MSTVWQRIVNRDGLCCVPSLIGAYCLSAGMWGVSGHVGIQICPLLVLQSTFIHSVSHWVIHGWVQWSLNEVIFRGSNPSHRQRGRRKKRPWHVVVSWTPALLMSSTQMTMNSRGPFFDLGLCRHSPVCDLLTYAHKQLFSCQSSVNFCQFT